jgi:hypothetical protein
MIGVMFLLNNIRPDVFSLSHIGDYWPFLLIAAGVIGLIEVLFHAGRGVTAPPRPFYGAAIFWIVVAGFFISNISRNPNFRFGRFDNPGIGIFGSDYDYDVNVTESSRGVTRIVLDNVHGDLSLKGEDEGDIRITGRRSIRAFNRNEADRASQNTQVHVERQGDLLLIRTSDYNGPRFLRVSADLDIAIPRGISVESRGRNGDITVDGVDGTIDVAAGRGDVRLNHIGKDVHIESSRGGDIRATDIKGGVDLQGRGSDIQVENIEGPVTVNGEFGGTIEFRGLMKPMHFTSLRTEFRAEAVPGTITMDLGSLRLTNVSGPVFFKTSIRDIQATDITGALDLRVDRGDIQVTVSKTPLPRIDAHTRVGDITLSLPENADFQLQGSTLQGEVENNYGSLDNHSDGRGATVSSHSGNGPAINVGTNRGNIAVKKN